MCTAPLIDSLEIYHCRIHCDMIRYLRVTPLLVQGRGCTKKDKQPNIRFRGSYSVDDSRIEYQVRVPCKLHTNGVGIVGKSGIVPNQI